MYYFHQQPKTFLYFRVIVATSAMYFACAPVSNAGSIAEAINDLIHQETIERSVSLSELGIIDSISLAGESANHQIFFPVPADIDLLTPELDFKGHYIRTDGGRTTYTLSVDDTVILGRSLQDAEGLAEVSFSMDDTERSNGFIKLGVNWSSSIDQSFCSYLPAIGNSLHIMPETRLTYQFRTADIRSISTAWSSLPLEVKLLLAAPSVDASSYEAAWQLGMALKDAGKNVVVIALPETGDVVDITGIEVPAELTTVPAFSLFTSGNKVRLTNDAHLGAYLILRAPAFRPDIVVASDELNTRLDAAFSSLATELETYDSEASIIISDLRTQPNSLPSTIEAQTVSLRTLAGLPVIAVSPNGTIEAVSIFDTLWRSTALSNNITIYRSSNTRTNDNSFAFGDLHQFSGNLDATARSEWLASFSTSDIAPGKVPASLDIKVSAAPGATTTRPVASVFLNDYLLGAKQLIANGQPESIFVDVPPYAVRPLNFIAVQFQRQPAGDNCQERPQAFPVSILPDSQIFMRDGSMQSGFVSMISRLSSEAYVGVSNNWLMDAPQTLPTLIHVTQASGIRASTADFNIVTESATLPLDKPFLLFDLLTSGLPSRVAINDNAVSISNSNNEIFFDAAGMSEIATIEVIQDGPQSGMIYRNVGTGAVITQPFQFGQGDIAVLSNKGLLTSINSSGTTIYTSSGESSALPINETFAPNRLFTSSNWAGNAPRLLTALIIASFLVLLLLASIVRRRNRRRLEQS